MKTRLLFIFLLIINISFSQTDIEYLFSADVQNVSQDGDVINYSFHVIPFGSDVYSQINFSNTYGLENLQYVSGDSNNNSIIETNEDWLFTATHIVTQAELDNNGVPSNSDLISYELTFIIEKPNGEAFLYFVVENVDVNASTYLTDDVFCADSINNTISLDLTYKDTLVLNGNNPNDYTITYHQNYNDAFNATNVLTNPYVVSDMQRIYARRESNIDATFEVFSFIIYLNDFIDINTPTALENCQDNFTFDLASKNDEIIGGQTNMIVTYHPTLLDAENNLNMLPFLYNGTTQQQIFVRVTSFISSCYNTTTLMLDFVNCSDSDGDGVTDNDEVNPPNGGFSTDPNDPCNFNIEDITLVQSSNFLQADCDNDGISNEIELGSNPMNPVDTDGDALIDMFDLDSDNDGVVDEIEFGDVVAGGDSDGDNLPNYLDQDSDNDGIPDNVEAQTTENYLSPTGLDSDQDGIDDAYDNSTNSNWIFPINSDNDNKADYLDDDSDDDGLDDNLESGIQLLGVDVDNDGLDDGAELNPFGYEDPNGILNNGAIDLPNTDGTGDVDFRDSSLIVNDAYTVNPLAFQMYSQPLGNTFNFDDAYTELIPLNFGFNYFGTEYQQVTVGTNSVISFNQADAGGFCPWQINTTDALPNANVINNAVLGVYQDYDNSNGVGSQVYGFIGSAPFRKFVVYFDDVSLFFCNDIASSNQMILYETYNFIDVQVKDRNVCSTWNNGNAILGIQNIGGTEAYFPPNRNTSNWEAHNEAWRFKPQQNYPDFQYIICDPEVDGIELFDLESIISEFEASPGSAFNFFETLADAEAFTNAIPLNYTNTNNTQTIYLRIDDNLTGLVIKQILLAAIDCAADYDLDNVPTIDEDLNGNGNYGDDDTDGDQIPDFIDEDDDGDYVLTNVEAINTRNTTSVYLDTDGDQIPNYLDNDDDGDGILTLAEDTNGNYILTDDDDDNDGIPNYLDNEALSIGSITNLFSIYPNPANNSLTIKLEELLNNTIFTIYNLQGKVVYKKQEILNLQTEINITNFSSGVYFIKLASDNNTAIKKFVKK